MRASRRLHRPWLSPITSEWFDRMLALVGDERYSPLLVCRVEDGAIIGYYNISDIIGGGLKDRSALVHGMKSCTSPSSAIGRY